MTTKPQSLAREIAAIKRALRTLAQPRLAFSSVDDGSISFYDGDTLVGVIGVQDDGSMGLVIHNGPPSEPVAGITFEAAPGGVNVVWDGTLLDNAPIPADFVRVEIRAEEAP